MHDVGEPGAGSSTMKMHSKDFRVAEGDQVSLEKWPTKVEPVYKSKHQYDKLLEKHVAQLSAQQQLHYASNRHAILLIFQAMDAAGKDGAIRHVMSGVNPQGCQVFSFKHPSVAELEHDFLWRTTRDLPERGRIGIFNRSYYEEVLIVRVHPELLSSEALVDLPADNRAFWHQRYRSITNRGHSIDFHLTRDALTVRGKNLDVAPISLSVAGKTCEFLSGTTRVFQLDDAVPKHALLKTEPGG
jgi:polyphosphate kinase 2 (PPK2 family)